MTSWVMSTAIQNLPIPMLDSYLRNKYKLSQIITIINPISMIPYVIWCIIKSHSCAGSPFKLVRLLGQMLYALAAARHVLILCIWSPFL